MNNAAFVTVNEAEIKDKFNKDLSIFFNRRVDFEPLEEVSEEYADVNQKADTLLKKLQGNVSEENKSLLLELEDCESYKDGIAENQRYQQGFQDAFKMVFKLLG